MDFQTLIDRVTLQYSKGLPFAFYSYAGSKTVKCLLQKNNQLYTDNLLSKNGFVIAPFDSQQDTFLIPESESELITASIDLPELIKERVEISETKEDEEAYDHLLLKTINTIKEGNAKKIVVSRKKEFKLKGFNLQTLVNRLFSAQPTAFRYVWFHPSTGIWCGATPETLVNIKKSVFKTMALAGTQPYKEGEVTWRKKELDEQYFVTEAILENLKGLVENVKVGPVETHRAGTLYHLKADITGALKEEPGILSKITNILHPTPAVCGTPQNYSRDFIIESEGYPREFYTGFTGPIEDNGTSASLMVNLRSMRIKDEVARVFVGGGVTIDSDVDEEWRETHNKMQTMLQVLQPML
ncbi:MAG TPA: isochorismate synthase [Aequorivita sp.]|nr:isochorismate synthase [Aequorivita sp.]